MLIVMVYSTSNVNLNTNSPGNSNGNNYRNSKSNRNSKNNSYNVVIIVIVIVKKKHFFLRNAVHGETATAMQEKVESVLNIVLNFSSL